MFFKLGYLAKVDWSSNLQSHKRLFWKKKKRKENVLKSQIQLKTTFLFNNNINKDSKKKDISVYSELYANETV